MANFRLIALKVEYSIFSNIMEPSGITSAISLFDQQIIGRLLKTKSSLGETAVYFDR